MYNEAIPTSSAETAVFKFLFKFFSDLVSEFNDFLARFLLGLAIGGFAILILTLLGF